MHQATQPIEFYFSKLIQLGLVLSALLLINACGEDDTPPLDSPGAEVPIGTPLVDLPYQPESYNFRIPPYLPHLVQPDSNIATKAGVELGRMLFFDPILSRDSSFSCASCHIPALAFTDGRALSKGIDGVETFRSSMSLVNVGFQNTFFWDGRSGSLEEQSLHPVEDQIELAAEWTEIENRFRRSAKYQRGFRAAFGIENTLEIDRYLAAKAIAQFERSIISGTSEYDRVTFQLSGFFSDAEESGRELFFTEPTSEHPGCAHCHNAPLFGDNRFANNGLTATESLDGFPDDGRGLVTGNPYDNGKFKAPSLRNIVLTAPYMHDGRLATLDDVLDHYSSGGHYSPTIDPQITGFPSSAADRANLKAFLATLTDTIALGRPEVQNPN